jgi:micrococcal nuclease
MRIKKAKMKTWQKFTLILGSLGVLFIQCLACIILGGAYLQTLPTQTTIERAVALSPPLTIIATDIFTITSLLPPTFTPIPTQTPILSLTPIPISNLPISEASCIPKQTPQKGIVTKIIDGDTIDVSINNQTFTIRYIGIDTPEMGIVMAAEAKRTNSDLVMGKFVLLYKDHSETDKYGRLLRYVLIGNIFVNYELVHQGFAQAKSFPPDISCDDRFASAQNEAQLANLGLWLSITKTQASPPIQSSTKIAGNCDPAYPEVCIPPPPPDLDCKDITYRNFKVLPPDPHNFDGDKDGIGCEGQ